ncbi:MAG: hypothetical protein OEY93_08520, partial [Anaerolineae bacterium]|nr:hypothetical protein [Anaerolineae bacterium]
MNDPVIEDKSKMNDRKALIIGCAIGLALIICLGCLAATGAWAYFTAKEISGSDYFFAPTSVVSDEQPVPHNIPEEFVGFEHETIETLQNTVVPFNDPVDLARRLKGLENVPDLLIDVNAPHKVGEKMEFNITNTSTNKNFKTKAVLEYVTDHSYFWVQEGVNFNANHLEALAEAFENDIYPTNREFFGSEWSPGVDGDNHIYILYVKGTGANNAGYFSSSDSLHPLAHENSNAHETFVFNADNVSFDDEFTYGVLAHEFQHMIHWNLDRNEESWINEGFSEVATLLNGYDPGGFEYAYINNTDLQLTDWPNNPNATTPHYGASFLFLTYFLDRFGEHATQALVAHPDNGIESVDKVLADIEAQDPLTGEAIGADDVVMDWAITNFLLDPKVSDGRYFYNNYPNAPKAPASQGYPDCSPGSKN